jgi:hypothetical protein
MRGCLIESCKRGPTSRGLCGSHYPILWALVKLGFIEEGELIDAGFLLPSKCLQHTKKLELKSTKGSVLHGTVTIDGGPNGD